MKTLLTQLKACKEAREWAGDKSLEEIYNTCHRGDWLLWLFDKTNPRDFQLLTLVKGHCANTVRHLMKDQCSINAVDAAIAFGEGKISIEELKDAAADACAAAAYTASYAAYYAASYAAYYAASYAAADACAAACADACAAACAAADAAAREENQKLTADIVRKYIPIEKFYI